MWLNRGCINLPGGLIYKHGESVTRFPKNCMMTNFFFTFSSIVLNLKKENNFLLLAAIAKLCAHLNPGLSHEKFHGE